METTQEQVKADLQSTNRESSDLTASQGL